MIFLNLGTSHFTLNQILSTNNPYMSKSNSLIAFVYLLAEAFVSHFLLGMEPCIYTVRFSIRSPLGQPNTDHINEVVL